MTEEPQTLPHAAGPEKAVLSVLMKYPERIASTPLDVADFYLPAHRLLYREMKEAGESLELISFVDSLQKRGLIEDIGGPAAVTDVFTYAPNDAHLDKHLAEIRDCHQRREAIAHAARATEAAYDRSDAEGYLSEMNKAPDVVKMATAPGTKRLADFAVNHSGTIGLSWEQIEQLRPPFIIDGFLRRGELLLLGAESKSRKSWLAQDAGFSVAAGLPWLAEDGGEGGFETAKAAVHVIDLELDRSEMLFRFAKARGNRFPDDPLAQGKVSDAFRSFCFDGMNVADIMPRIDEIRETVKPGDLVILDCFYRLVPDGNETKDVALMLETLRRFAKETQCGIIVVDHFRKAGDEKARNRFAGSFVKQASASTLVAIEVGKDDVLTLFIDARTFHGNPTVHARFTQDSYTFNRVPDDEIEAGKVDKKRLEQVGQIVALWRSRHLASSITAADAGEKWGISRQAAEKRLGKLVADGLADKLETPKNKAAEWILTDSGQDSVSEVIGVAPAVAPKS